MDPTAPQPTLRTPRLVLRPLAANDAPTVQLLAGDRRVAEMTANIPHPYPDGAAEAWIASHGPAWAAGTGATWAIALAGTDELVGAVGLVIDAQSAKASLGYWIGLPFWGRGYATEAAQEAVRFAFEVVDLNRVEATHLVRNPASGRVMEKLGMVPEGVFRQAARRWGRLEDIAQRAVLRHEWEAGQRGEDRTPPGGPIETAAPILEFDPAREAIIEAVHVEYVAAARGSAATMPERVVLCFFQDVIAKLVAEHAAERVATLNSEIGPNAVYRLNLDVPVALVHPGVGAPLAAGFLEELIGFGARLFVAVGGAGALVPNLTLGHVIVPTAAIRDEGTSYHYLPAAREARPTQRVVDALVGELDRRDVPYVMGKMWTTDAIFRETRARAARRVAEGCIAVDMEAAAFYAVAAFRGVSFGQLLYAGDDLSGEVWDERGWIRHESGREALLRIALGAITRLAP